jgi:uncharacterized protein (DUF885 family)
MTTSPSEPRQPGQPGEAGDLRDRRDPGDARDARDARDASDAVTRLDKLADAYWTAALEGEPLLATAAGDPRFDDRMADPTPEGATAHRARLTAILADVDAMGTADDTAAGVAGDGGVGDGPGLPPAHRVTWSVLRACLDADVAGLDSGLRDWNVDSLEGVPAGLLMIPDYQRVDTPAAGDKMAARWHAMAGYVDAHTQTLRRSLTDGRVAATPTVDRDIALLDELLAEPVDRWPLVQTPVTGAAAADAWTAGARDRFAATLHAVTQGEIRPAFARLRAFLADEVRPVARPDTAPGMSHVDGGLDGYRKLIRVHTSLNLAPEALHQTGLLEIDRIDAQIEALAARVLGTRSLEEAIARLRNDPALGFSTREEVLAGGAEALGRAQAATPAFFGRLPQAPCEVVAMGPHEGEHGTIAYYREPAVDGLRPGQFYLNLSHPETRRRYESEALAYHESVPGHHLQIAIAQEIDGLPDFRRHLGTTAFVEGWGLYSESLASEMGLYSGDLSLLGTLSFDAWRASRLVVDTGMHALGWSRERAVAFMTAHTALAANNIANEIDRYIGMPAQALAYKTGQLEMLRLRAAAESRLGSRFDIRGFHDTLLGSGAVPLAVMGELIDAWVGSRLG